MSPKEAKKRSIDMLDSVGIVDPAARFYPYLHAIALMVFAANIMADEAQEWLDPKRRK